MSPHCLLVCLALLSAGCELTAQCRKVVNVEEIVPELDFRDRSDDDLLRTLRYLEGYEETGDPRVLLLLAVFYHGKFVPFPSEKARHERILEVMMTGARCGDPLLVQELAATYRYGRLSVEKNPELVDCLEAKQDLDEYWLGRRVRFCLKRWASE